MFSLASCDLGSTYGKIGTAYFKTALTEFAPHHTVILKPNQLIGVGVKTLSVWDQGLGFDPWATQIRHSIANNSPVAIVVMVLQRSKLCCLSANDRQMTKKETA